MRSHVGALLLAVRAGIALAQDGGLSDAQRLHRDAESPLRWIRVHADTPPARPAAAASAPNAPLRRALARPPAKADQARPPARTAGAAAAREPPAAAASAPAGDAPAQPVVLERAGPRWDPALVEALRRGRVELRFTVAADGRLVLAEVAESSDARLDAAALAALKAWRFGPTPQPSTARVEFGFDLEGAAPSAPAAPRAPADELVAREQAEPAWDDTLVNTLRRGRVRVAFELGSDGRIRSAEVAESSDARLNEAALEAIRRWRFEPPAQARRAAIEFGFDLGP